MTKTVGASRKDLEWVRQWFENETSSVLAPLLEYASLLEDRSRESFEEGVSPLSPEAVEGLSDVAESIIGNSALTIGAGFIAAPGVVDATERYMMWLQRRSGAIRRLRLNFDTSDLDAYDYVGMDWFTRTREEHRPSLTGPYLDYSGSHALVLTVAAPVTTHERFLGVVAIDLMAQAAEEQMREQLCDLAGDVVVVNRDRAIVATNSVRWMPGERLRSMPAEEPGQYQQVLPIGTWTGWQLAVAQPESSKS